MEAISMPITPVENFYKIFNVFNNVLMIFGLSSLRPQYDGNRVEYKFSYICVVYSFGISALIVYVFYLQVTLFNPKDDNLVFQILYWYLAVVGTIMSILMITTAICNTNNYARIINNPEYFEVFTLMSNANILKWASVKQLCLSFSILTACYLWDYISGTVNSEDGKISFARAFIILMYFLFPIYNSLCISQFYIVLFWLGRLFSTINTGLVELRNQTVSKNKTSRIRNVSGSGSFIANYKEYTVDGFGNGASVIKADKILRLRRLYHKSYKLSHFLNKIQATRNLLLVLHHCALGTVYTYWAIRHSFPGVKITLHSLLNLYRAAVMSLVSIMWLIWPSIMTVNEVGRTKVLIHDLMAVTNNRESIEELRIFSLQLIQEPLYFAPHDFFNLSTKALLSMLSAVTSYLVILLQYHMYIEVQAGKNTTSSN